MNYYNFVNTILETSKSHKLVYEVGEGDIYEHLNSGDHKYPCVFLTVQNVDSNGSQMTVTGSLFYVDALLSDTSNKLQIQSTGMTTLQQIFMRLMDNYPDFDLRTGRYTPFDEKFADLCAGVFSNFTVSFMDDICIINDDIFEGDEPITPEPEGKYMTITVLDGASDTVISPIVKGNISPNLQYRINNGDWNEFIFGQTNAIHAVSGDVVQWKGNNPDGLSTSISNRISFSISGNPVSLSGNLMSLLDGKGETLVIPSNFCFNNLFRDSTIKTISSDFLPATTLSESCYTAMFSGCTALENSPEFPATTLSKGCYENMFMRCTSLKNAPELPATTLSYSCYRSMFYGCTALTTAPVLPATTLAVNCYAEMFYKCTSLATAPVLPATKLAGSCYISMFYGCTSLTTAPELPATTIAGSCYDMMFQGCSSLVDAPALPATKLADRCYSSMFSGCTSLTTAPELPATTLDTWCYYSMFEGCTSLVNVPKILPATKLADRCYPSMFYGCTSLTTAPELPATTLAYDCYASMFSGCTSLTTAPVLPATTLADSCYLGMFENCKNMNYVKCLATDITATNALKDWLYNVARTGTFVKKYGVEYLINSISGIPKGWTIEEIDAPIPEPKYMTITVDDNAGETIISPKVSGSIGNISRNLQYRLNGGDWTDYVFGQTSEIRVFAGDVVQLKGNNPDGLSVNDDNRISIHIYDKEARLNGKRPLHGNVHLSGNVMSLIDGVGETTVIPNDYCFDRLFGNSDISTVSKDFLPATELKPYCYQYMFYECETMTNSPELPATVMKHRCYGNMFYLCFSLVDAPALNSTTLADGCYLQMFRGCTSLEIAPELPATTLYDFCYDAMFFNCEKLTHAPVLPATVMKTYCYEAMFYGCKSLTTAPQLPATELASTCYSRMFWGCTSLVNVPEILPATTISYQCYISMFENCTSLVKAPVLPATSITSFGCYTSMFSGCYNLNYVKCLAIDGISSGNTSNWLSNVASKGTFVKPAGVSYETGSSGIPDGWTIQNI